MEIFIGKLMKMNRNKEKMMMKKMMKVVMMKKSQLISRRN